MIALLLWALISITNEDTIIGYINFPTYIHEVQKDLVIESNPITLFHLGDMMLDRHVAVQIERHGFDWLFAPLVSSTPTFFSAPDLTVVNLEGPFTKYRIDTSKSIAFRFDPILAPFIRDLGVDVVTLANNHSYDMGSAAFVETQQVLTSSSIRYVGEQYSITTSSLHYEQVGSTTIAFVAINDTHPNTPIEKGIELIAVAEATADITLVTIHWGAEYQPLSNDRQRMLAHQFVDAGADAVIGHHPHVVQELEIYNGVPIAYSLGNLMFDQYFSVETQQGMGILFTIEDNAITKLEIYPFKSIYSQLTTMTTDELTKFMNELLERSRLDGYTVSSTRIIL